MRMARMYFSDQYIRAETVARRLAVSPNIACVDGGIVRVRGWISTVELYAARFVKVLQSF